MAGICPVFARIGTTAKPLYTMVAGNFSRNDTKSYHSSGDVRQLYAKHIFNGTGGGEVQRLLASVTAANAATGATINAEHATVSISGSGTISGAANAIRATIGVGASLTPGGTIGALQLDSDIGAGATVANMALLRMTKSGSVDVPYALAVDDDQVLKGNGTLGAITSGDALKVRGPAGQAWYIPLVVAG